MTEKKLEDLTMKELLEDLGYWIQHAQYQSPPFTDGAYSNIWESFNALVSKVLGD